MRATEYPEVLDIASNLPLPGKSETLKDTSVFRSFRRLKGHEVVRHGDFMADEHFQLKPWDGPGGFQADTFLRPIYRVEKSSK